MSHPLTGIRVLDLTRLLPGAICTMMLADLGADVIKVEDPNGGDYARWMGPSIDGQSVFFRMNNRSKRSLILNLKTPQGQIVFHRLAAGADVVVEGFRPGVMARLNCDYQTLAAANARLVYCSLSGWGADGPYADASSHDLNYAAVAGLTAAMETPQVMGGQVADVGGAYIAVTGILAALFRRERSGAGAFVDASLAESALPFGLYNWAEALALGVTPGHGVLTGGLACYRVYQSKDGRPLALGALEEKFWSNFCHAVGRPDLVEYHMIPDRQAYLIAELTGIFSAKTAAEWQATLGSADCCFTVGKNPGEVQDDPHWQARAMLGCFPDGTPWMRSPVRISASQPRIANDAPAYGAHTTAVLLEAGFAQTEIDELMAGGIVRQG